MKRLLVFGFLSLFFVMSFKFSDKSYALTLYPPTEKVTNVLDSLNDAVAGERVEDFNSNITISKDGSILVKETIKYFFDTYRHGIYRNIPFTKYDKGKRYDLEFNFKPVTDEKGKKYHVAKSKNGEQWVLKIGDSNKTITGNHTYIISYSVKGALGYFEDHDEIYWNVTGNGWDVPIKKTITTITLPAPITDEKIQIVCFTGPYGSKKHNCSGTSNGKTAAISTTLFLNSGEGLSIVEAFPKGIVAVLKPQLFVPFFERWYGKLALIGLAIVAFLWYLFLPVYLVIKWFRMGRDPEVGIAVTATYDPPKIGKPASPTASLGGRFLTPAETGALVDEMVDKRDVFATIVDLARRGHLKISEPKSKEFHLLKTQPNKKDSFQPFEQTLYDGIFEDGDDVELKKVNLYTTVASVEKELYTLLVSHGFFIKNPKATRSLYYALGGVALFTANFVLMFIAFVFGRVMPKKTLLGAQTSKKAEGLKNFLKSQERQLNYQGDRQMLFEKLLPYAVAFGVEKQWAKRFEKFDLKNPEWYQGSSSSHFNTVLFAANLNNSYSNFAVSSTPPSSSSSGFSGGSSGGGGGGGGGGSW